MMSVNLAGETFEVEGLLWAGQPACSLRRPGGGPLGAKDFERLHVHEQATLLIVIRQHIDAVALLSGLKRPADESIQASRDVTGDIGCLSGPTLSDSDTIALWTARTQPLKTLSFPHHFSRKRKWPRGFAWRAAIQFDWCASWCAVIASRTRAWARRCASRQPSSRL